MVNIRAQSMKLRGQLAALGGATVNNHKRLSCDRPGTKLLTYYPKPESHDMCTHGMDYIYIYRRYFQHAHFIPIVGVGKRGVF